MRDVVIVSAVRTPIGNFDGALKELSALELGSIVIREAVKRSSIDPANVDEVIMGNVLPSGLGQNPARQAMIRASLPMTAGALTVNKVCGSGLKAVMLAAQAIACGDAEVVVAGGMESMNNAPYYLENARFGYRMGNRPLIDGMVHDGLLDIVNNYHMGYTAELVAKKFAVSREDMDRFAFLSNKRAMESINTGLFQEEIIPVTVKKKGGESVVDTDEGPRATTMEILAALKPAFNKDGLVTAGNASKISDGAAAMVLMVREKARSLGIPPMARVGAQGAAGVPLEDVLVAPIESIPRVLKKARLTLGDIDLHEINEAFAASTIAVMRKLDIPVEKLNVHGGAIALGHPIGASGARVLVTLLYAMKKRNARRAMASLCLGGGEAVSLIVEQE
ncbi:MAG: acetyl-CoA C-acetyltransferase [Proteobacteria bacterium]|nr:acetyl-CoA C-acetyltransferase [Pseudomonadota bacterium]